MRASKPRPGFFFIAALAFACVLIGFGWYAIAHFVIKFW